MAKKGLEIKRWVLDRAEFEPHPAPEEFTKVVIWSLVEPDPPNGDPLWTVAPYYLTDEGETVAYLTDDLPGLVERAQTPERTSVKAADGIMLEILEDDF